MRAEPPKPIYTKSSFLKLYSPVSGNYNLPAPYRGSEKSPIARSASYDGLRDSLHSAKDKISGMYSAVIDGIRDSYKSIKGGSAPQYELGLSYRG